MVKDMLESLARTADFWGRVTRIYATYKLTQLHAAALAAAGSSKDRVEQRWAAQHAWAGQEMYRLAVDLRGFYLKARGGSCAAL